MGRSWSVLSIRKASTGRASASTAGRTRAVRRVSSHSKEFGWTKGATVKARKGIGGYRITNWK